MAQSYLDYNLFNQIAQTSNYDRKVAQKQQELEYATRLEDRANKRVQQQMINQEKVAQYIEEIDNKLQGLLGPDQERLRQIEKQKRQMVIQGVAAAQGDYQQFLLQGGASTLREYKNAIMQSDEATYAFKNADTYKQIMKDMSEQKLLKNVTATYTDDKGREVTAVMDASDMLNKFFDGKIKNLTYNGAEKAVSLNPFEFAKTPNPKNPYESDYVSLEEIRDFMILKGQDADLATQRAQGYAAFERDGKLYSNFMWGQKEEDWRGLERMWGRNTGTKSGAGKYYQAQEKFGDYIGAALTQDLTNQKQRDWHTADGKVKKRFIIGDVDIDKSALDAIVQETGLILTAEGYKGKVGNTIGFMNMENGQLAKIGASDYDVTSVGGIKIVKDAETGTPQMFIEAEIQVTEDYMEDHLGEGAWWNGWTADSKQWGTNVVKDVYVNGEDMRRITVGIPVPMSPMIKERINQKIGWEQGQVKGGIQQQDYVSQYQYAPEGTDIINNDNFQKVGNQYLNTTSPFGTTQGSDAQQYQRAFSESLSRIQTNPNFSHLNQTEIYKLAERAAQQVLANRR